MPGADNEDTSVGTPDRPLLVQRGQRNREGVAAQPEADVCAVVGVLVHGIHMLEFNLECGLLPRADPDVCCRHARTGTGQQMPRPTCPAFSRRFGTVKPSSFSRAALLWEN